MRVQQNRFEASPFPGAWWVSTGEILAGPHPAAASGTLVSERVDSLVRMGVRTLVDLTQPHEEGLRGSCERWVADLVAESAELHGCEVRTLRRELVDEAIPSPRVLHQVLALIKRESANGLVYVHCWHGVGRTSVAAGVYLMEVRKVDPIDCLDAIAQRRTAAGLAGLAPSNPGQRTLLERWELGDGT